MATFFQVARVIRHGGAGSRALPAEAYSAERHEELADLGDGAPKGFAAFVACGGRSWAAMGPRGAQ